jgi:DNA-binding transcriptional LysR family regulator
LTSNEPASGLQQRSLFEDRTAMIVRADHPLMRRKSIRVPDLQSYQWILLLPDHFHRRKLETFFESEGLPPPREALECSSTGLIISIVHATDHIGLIAKMGLQDRVAIGANVVKIPDRFVNHGPPDRLGLAGKPGPFEIELVLHSSHREILPAAANRTTRVDNRPATAKRAAPGEAAEMEMNTRNSPVMT